MIGETIGNFKVTKRIGTGGMGEVWLAEQQSIGTHVAIKLLNEQVSKDSEHVQRFFNEARAVSRIQHAGIVKIFDVGTHAGRAYLIMEYLEGETLSQRLKGKGRLPFSQIADIGKQIASVLDATHSAGITHRDLKPDNIFLVPDRELGERVKILDFGIAKLSGTLAAASPRTLGTMGTPAYMAPEQWGDTSKVDWRADMYSLGCVTFEMTCGRPPFKAETIAEACGQHINAEPPKASSLAPQVPAALERLIDQLLAKEPGDRGGSMRDVARTFATVDKDALGVAPTITTDPVSLPLPTQVGPPRRSRAVPILLGLVMLGGGAAAAIYVLQEQPPSEAAGDAAIAVATEEPNPVAKEPRAPDREPQSKQSASSPSPNPPAVDAAGRATPPVDAAALPVDAVVATKTADAGAATKTVDAAVAMKIGDAGVATKAVDAGVATRTVDARMPTKPPKNAGSGSAATPPEGTADTEALQQAVRARSTQTNQCYENALKEDPSLSGMVTLQIVIDANGRVTRATADGMSDSLRSCVVAQVRAITFPRPKDPPVSLIVPFRFEKE